MEKENLQQEDMRQENAKDIISQLRPHFLFNALNQLRYFIRKDPELAYGLTYDFANYLRDRIEAVTGSEAITLREERKRLESYLSLEKLGCVQLEYECEWEEAADMQAYAAEENRLIGVAERLVKEYIRSSDTPVTLYIRGRKLESGYCVSVSVEDCGTVEEISYNLLSD